MLSRCALKVLYITYDGLAEPLGQSQVLPYVRGLAALGHSFQILSYEKRPERIGHAVLGPNIERWALRYHRRPTVPATGLDIATGIALGTGLVLRSGVRLLHARSYVSATIALAIARATGTPFLFDTRGNWVDEKVQSGAWHPDSKLVRAARIAERTLFEQADAITVLTNAYHAHLRSDAALRIRGPISVIPTCVDLDAFSPDGPVDEDAKAVASGRPILVYLGSLGGFYRDRELAKFYLAYRRCVGSSALFMVVSRQDPSRIRDELAAAGCAHELYHRSASRAEVPALLRASTAMVALDDRGIAGLGAAPTKLGEALGVGLPVAITRSGDVARVLETCPAGVLVDSLHDESLAAAARALHQLSSDARTAGHARRTAVEWFSLDAGVRAYDALYERMIRPSSDGLDRMWPPTVALDRH